MDSQVTYIHSQTEVAHKEQAYLQVRANEGRILSDDAVSKLPKPAPNNPLKQEWALREKSYSRLINQIKKFPKPQCILDIGCGNGWFTGLLAREFPQSTIEGIDLNAQELEQANRLFGNARVHFLYLDILTDKYFDVASVDMIFFNASIQYFPDLKAILAKAISLLKPGGSIWINDSPFYKNETEQNLAAARSKEYYIKMKCPEMTCFYHHHLESDLLSCGFQKVRIPVFWKSFPFSLYQYARSF